MAEYAILKEIPLQRKTTNFRRKSMHCFSKFMGTVMTLGIMLKQC